MQSCIPGSVTGCVRTDDTTSPDLSATGETCCSSDKACTLVRSPACCHHTSSSSHVLVLRGVSVQVGRHLWKTFADGPSQYISWFEANRRCSWCSSQWCSLAEDASTNGSPYARTCDKLQAALQSRHCPLPRSWPGRFCGRVSPYKGQEAEEASKFGSSIVYMQFCWQRLCPYLSHQQAQKVCAFHHTCIIQHEIMPMTLF